MTTKQTTAKRGYSDAESRWQAVQAREVAADGAFFYGVRSTGVYCRASCPSRRPSLGQTVFFETSEAAQQAGFRACLRCKPEAVTAEQMAVAKVLQLIEASETAPTLDELANEVGLSSSYLQRIFKRQTGMSPRQYAATLRQERFRKGLRASKTVTDAVYEAGFGSTRAAYESAGENLGMRPSAYRQGGRGEKVTFALAETELGDLLVAATERGVCAVRFGARQDLLNELAGEFRRAELVEDAKTMAAYVREVKKTITEGITEGGLRLDASGSEFQLKVWAALRQIPAGQTRTYSQIAEAIGEPKAARAVAMACARNPLALLTPCHRVVRADGTMGGYRWGIARKQEILRREGAIG